MDEFTDRSVRDNALSVYPVAKKVFDSLSTEDLFNCRLVSYNWKIISTPFLQSRTKLNLYGFNLSFPSSLSSSSSLSTRKEVKHSIQELMTLLNHVDPLGTFPCRKFHLQGGNLLNEWRDKFLNEYGKFIDHLSLTIHQDPRQLLPNAVITEKVKNILIKKASNLKSFSLSVPSWKSSRNNNISPNCSPFLSNDSHFQSIQQNIQSNGVVNTNLKFLQISFDISATLLETIIQLSPNLQEMELDVKQCDMYISPLNRLHLLKKLKFNPFDGRIDKLEKLASFALDIAKTEENKKIQLLLREITFEFVDNPLTPELSDPIFQGRVANVVYDILQCSVSSLEEFSWYGESLLDGIQFPNVMPKVHSIKLMIRILFDPDLPEKDRSNVPHLFPKEFSFNKTFPSLRRVYVDSRSYSQYLTWVNFDTVYSVKNVAMAAYYYYTKEELIRRIFPNAICHKIYIIDGKIAYRL